MKVGRNKVWVAAGCVAALFAGIIAYAIWPPRSIRVTYGDRKSRGVSDDKSEQVRQMFDGDSGIETIRHSDKVEAYRIDLPLSPVNNRNRVGDYPILSGPVRVPVELTSELVAVLLSPESYVWEWMKMCDPEYGVCLSFYRMGDRVDILLCFECSIVMMAHNGVATGGEDFDYMRPTLVRAAKALFPSDSVIQGLTDEMCVPQRPEKTAGSDAAVPAAKEE